MIKKLSLFSFLILLSCGSDDESSHKIVFVDSTKLFEEFDMKKDYDKKIEEDLKQDAMSLDSMNVLMKNTADSNSIYQLRKDYYVLEQMYNAKFEKLSTRYTKLVADRLNEYIKKFSESKKLELVVSGGNGTILYVKETTDMTKQVVKFSNESYAKK
jgi:Skp family chaperone for outer membrane proteins